MGHCEGASFAPEAIFGWAGEMASYEQLGAASPGCRDGALANARSQ